MSSISETLYLDRPTSSSQVLLKLSRVILQSGNKVLETYAILNDGSERTILLHEVADHLGLQGKEEELVLHTVRQEVRTVHGATVSFSVAAASQPGTSFQIHSAFTAKELGLASHMYPVKALQAKYRHLKDLRLLSIKEAKPLLLIGLDYPHLITPVKPVRLGPPVDLQLCTPSSAGLCKVHQDSCTNDGLRSSAFSLLVSLQKPSSSATWKNCGS